LRIDRKGVIDLPVKLMVVALIVCISIPLLVNAMERGESNNVTMSMNSEIDKIFNTAAAVHYSGIGSSRTLTIAIPDGCEISIPGGSGSDSYTVKMTFKGRETGVRYMDSPPVRFVTGGLTITNSALLLITSDIIDGDPVVRVSVV